jgi:hypothetical protein
MDSEIELYVQVIIEKTDDGHRRAQLTRLSDPPTGDFRRECVTFRAWYPAQVVNSPATFISADKGLYPAPTDNDPTVRIGSAHLATVWLYWPLDLPGEKTRKRIYHHLKQNIRKYLRLDEFVRIALPIWNKSTGFYFILEGTC